MQISDISIRTTLQPGDTGYIIHRHGKLYHQEYGYGREFEAYVAEGLAEFLKGYKPSVERVWICEDRDTIVGFLMLLQRDETTAQLRYFYLEPAYRGMGLGNKLMRLFMDFLVQRGYQHAYLWTTHEQEAAAALYRKHGFVLTEEKTSTAFGKALTEMRYDLIVVRGH
ncbi:MAG TPA: GNAT family N-acetyltransferase [Puia sp.]|nr:GNAT family N-acetyltransferase [Puia sp.]